MIKPSEDKKLQSNEISSLNTESKLIPDLKISKKQMPNLYSVFIKDLEEKKEDTAQLIKKRLKYRKILKSRWNESTKEDYIKTNFSILPDKDDALAIQTAETIFRSNVIELANVLKSESLINFDYTVNNLFLNA